MVHVPPILDDGTPFPTLYWLTCPLAVGRISRLEGAGGIRRLEQKAEADPVFGNRLSEAHALMRPSGPPSWPGLAAGSIRWGRRDEDGDQVPPRPLRPHEAGSDNPVGELVAGWIEPLDCTVPCVLDGVTNPGLGAQAVKVGVVDIGTNSMRLLVTDGLEETGRWVEVTGLGRGVDATGAPLRRQSRIARRTRSLRIGNGRGWGGAESGDRHLGFP